MMFFQLSKWASQCAGEQLVCGGRRRGGELRGVCFSLLVLAMCCVVLAGCDRAKDEVKTCDPMACGIEAHCAEKGSHCVLWDEPVDLEQLEVTDFVVAPVLALDEEQAPVEIALGQRSSALEKEVEDGEEGELPSVKSTASVRIYVTAYEMRSGDLYFGVYDEGV